MTVGARSMALFSSPPVHETDLAVKAGNEALKRVTDFESFSSLPNESRNVMQLNWDALEMGPLVGTGAFSSVYTVTVQPRSRRRLESFLSFSEDDLDDVGGLLEPQSAPPKTYALKCLQQDVTRNEKSFTCAAVDLALEAKLLSRLTHENIIGLHGVTSGCVSTSFSEHDGAGFFLVLDLMVDTLDRKLEVWAERGKPFWLSNVTPYYWKPFHQKERQKQLDRMDHVALGIAKALEYLHSRNIMYRDLKPQNIGFDENDVVQIFDFGLAREVDQERKKNGIEMRQLTGEAGTPRYMAPEVARKEGFDFSSDVYSFSILLWEVCTLQKPFEDCKSRIKFENCVVHGGVRPPLHTVASSKIAKILPQGWNDDPGRRPSIATMRKAIENVLENAHKKEMARVSRWRRLPLWFRRVEFDSMENLRELDTCARRRTSFGLNSSRHSGDSEPVGRCSSRHSKDFDQGGRQGSSRGSFSRVQPQERRGSDPVEEQGSAAALRSASFVSNASGVSQASGGSRRLDDSRHSKRSALAEAMIETLAMEAKKDKKVLRERSRRRFGRRPNSGMGA